MRIVVVGGSVGGLVAALLCARAGHNVVILERDTARTPADPEEAWAGWRRPGVPQLRQLHAYPPRLMADLRARVPDLAGALLAAGMREVGYGFSPADASVPLEAVNAPDTPWLAGRRTTLEAALRRVVEREPRVELRPGVRVTGLTCVPADGGTARVTGVTTAAGVLPADLVVDAGGRRSAGADWVRALGCDVPPRTAEECGLTYHTRFFRGPLAHPDLIVVRPHGGPVIAVFPADDGTASVTVTAASDDEALRPLADTDAFMRVVGLSPVVAEEIALAEPITPVLVMGRARAERQVLERDGRPLAVGFVAVGDAAMCTNPVYGLGTTAAVVSAVALADALHGADDLAAVGSAHAARVREGLEPWFDESLAQDRRRAALRQGRLDEREAQRHLAVAVAVARDPAVGQAVLRTRGLLGPVSDLDEPWLQARIDEVRRGLADDPPDFGPPRGRLLAALHATAPAR